MTAEEAYDFLVSEGGFIEPVALKLGDRHILGYWTDGGALPKGKGIQGGSILRSEKKVVIVRGEGSCWITAMRATGYWNEYMAWKTKRVEAKTAKAVKK